MASSSSSVPYKPSKPTLFDVPVSNNGARLRYIIYKKNLEDQIDIVPPSSLGGLKSPEYLALNPFGKMPLYVDDNGFSLFESQVIEGYLLDKYKTSGSTTLIPSTPELRSTAALAVRIHDIYIASIQGCMYKPMENAQERFHQIRDISSALDALEGIVVGPFICGQSISYADSALMPTFVFLLVCLPNYFRWKSLFTNRPKLEAWWNAVLGDPVAKRVVDEVNNGLESWQEAKRWEEKGIEKQVEETDFDWSCGN